MRDSSKTKAERPVQPEFRKSWVAAGALLALGVLLFRAELNRMPNRVEVGQRTVPLDFKPVRLAAGSVGPFQIVGAWRLLADDPRFGGISALVTDGMGLLALSDSGVAARFPKPGTMNSMVALWELPGGPGNAGFKVNRDSEAFAADPAGRGWWVAFENRDELWLYDWRLSRAVGKRRIDSAILGRNRGIEGMLADNGGLLLFPERGDRAIRGTGTLPIVGLSGWVSDALRLPDGRLLVVNRRPTPIGLSNSLVVLERGREGYRAGAAWRIPAGRLDNVEALAAEPAGNGVTRLWMMTDNNLQQRHPTLLIALELRPRRTR